jgi:peptidoglycan/xylan/chitin deacetylase (PgdA/CDA1 family)
MQHRSFVELCECVVHNSMPMQNALYMCGICLPNVFSNIPRRSVARALTMEVPEMQKKSATSDIRKFACFMRKMEHCAIAFCSKAGFRREYTILMYHSISSTDDCFAVDPREFRRQIEYLRENYTIVSMDEMINFIGKRGDLPRKSVTITFDDGYHDFYINAYPYLRKNKLPATLFVTTGYVGSEWPRGNHHKILTWKEIEEISKNQIEIAAHSVTHRDLREIDPSEAGVEIMRSKKEIEKHTKKGVRYFSYPFGNYDSRIVEIVKSSGFEAAVGGEGSNKYVRESTQVFVLKRVQVDRSISFTLFKARLTKAWDRLEVLEMMAKRMISKPQPRAL